MYRALVEGKLTKAKKGLIGSCPFCDTTMVANCGDLKAHHWAHKSKKNCDEWYVGRETEWHYKWKERIGLEYSEKSITKKGVFHIADIHIPKYKADKELIIEFQNSPISIGDVEKRNNFYGKNLVWVLNGYEFRENVELHHEIPVDFHANWSFPVSYIFWSPYFMDKEVLYQDGFHITVPLSLLLNEYKQTLIKLGFQIDRKHSKKYNQRTNQYEKMVTFYKHSERLLPHEVDILKDNYNQQIKRAFDNYIQSKKHKRISYNWKYAKKAFSTTSRPIYIDLNDNELLELNRTHWRNGVGRLIEKEYFIEKIQRKVKLRQLV